MNSIVKFYRSLLVAMMVLVCNTASAQFNGGTGASDDPYLISGLSDLITWSNNSDTYSHCNFKLANDITLSGGAPTIGSFSGDLDGDGHKIKGLTGFMFYSLSGSVRSLTLEGNVSGASWPVGLLCENANGAYFTYVTVSGSISMESSLVMAGGICAESTGAHFMSCVSSVNISSPGMVGGICGQDNGGSEFYGCNSTGTLSGSPVGGILGDTKDLSSLRLKAEDGNTCSYGSLCGNASYGGGGTSGPFAGGTGTSDDPYQISNLDQLTQWAQNVASGESQNAYQCYILTNDVVVNDLPDINQFFGTFDGGNHTISGLSKPLFSSLQEATIKNLKVEGSVQSQSTAALVVDMANRSSFIKVSVSGTLTVGYAPAGGIAAQSQSSMFTSCSSSVAITTSNFAGGICGYDTGGTEFHACSSSATVSGGYSGSVGAILAYTNDADALVLGSDNTSSNPDLKLLCGNRPNPVEEDGFAGGNGTPDDPYIIANSAQLYYFLSNHDVYCTNSFLLSGDIDMFGYDWSNNYENQFSGTIDGAGHTISGLGAPLLNSLSSATVKDLSLKGDIIIWSNASDCGFLGVYASNSYLENVSVLGKLTSGSISGIYLGGILGVSTQSTFQGCTTAIEISSQAAVAGGLCGYDSYGTKFYDCRSSAKVDAYVAGPFLGQSNRQEALVLGDDNIYTEPGGADEPEIEKLFTEGSGTKDDPYYITSFDDLKKLKDNCMTVDETTGNRYSAEHYVLVSDIEFETSNPIIALLEGSFDGGGHIFNGMNSYLFEKVTGSVSNIELTGTVNSTTAGPVALLCLEARGATFTGVTVNGVITTEGEVAGGVCATASNSVFTDCVSNVSVTSDDAAGGICGKETGNSEFHACMFSGTATAAFCGGIVGYTYNPEDIVLADDNKSSVVKLLCGNIDNNDYSTLPPLSNTEFFCGGSGTIDDPWLIKTKEHLIQLAQNFREYDKTGKLYEEGNYKLIADIDLTDCGYDGSNGTFIYGTLEGTFNGNNHSIIGLTKPLFYTIGYSATHKRRVWDLRISGNIDADNVGSADRTNEGCFGLLSCRVFNSDMSNIAVSGSVRATKQGSLIGGITGLSTTYNNINNNYVACKSNVTLTGGDDRAAYSPDGTSIGGIVGENHYSTFENCTTSGVYSKGTNVGGIAGFSGAEDATKTYWSVMKDNTTSATMTDGKNIGFIVGYQEVTPRPSVPDDCYYIGIYHSNTYDGDDNLKPYGNYNGDPVYFAEGTGTATDPFIISSEKYLKNFAYVIRWNAIGTDYQSSYYKLTADINVDWDWDSHYMEFHGGGLDGNGKIISGLNNPLIQNVENATIKNLTLVSDGDMSLPYEDPVYGPDPYSEAGLVCRHAENVIFDNITVKGSLHPTNNLSLGVGGVAGYAEGSTFSNCVSEVDIVYNYAGGICGNSSDGRYEIGTPCVFTNCVSYATLTGYNLGGICGQEAGYASFTNCESYATFNVVDVEEESWISIGSVLGYSNKPQNLTLGTDNRYFGDMEINLCGNREDPISDKYFTNGKGTYNDPYILKTEGDLRMLAKAMADKAENADGQSYSNACYYLNNNIAIKKPWTTIDETFTGILLGTTHPNDIDNVSRKITGLTAPMFNKIVRHQQVSEQDYVYSVAWVDFSGTISDDNEKTGVVCREADEAFFYKVSVEGSVASTHPVAKVGGISGTSTSAYFHEVKPSVTVSGVYAGGISGYDVSTTSFTSCISYAVVETSATAGSQCYLGSIVGYSADVENIRLDNVTYKGKKLDLWICGNIEPEASTFARGDGTEEDPYVIANKEQFKNFCTLCNGDNIYDPVYLGEHYILACDIELTAEDTWAHIEKRFSGALDGNYDDKVHTISVMSRSLFCFISQATVQNLNLEGDITIGGGLLADDIGSSVIKNISASGSVNVVDSHCGGISGYASESLFENCSSEVNIYNVYDVGGICGDANISCRFINCSAKGNLSGYRYVGGICGTELEATEFVGCSTDVTLSIVASEVVEESYVGYILGHTSYKDFLTLGLDNVGPDEYWRCGNIREYKDAFGGGSGTTDDPYLINNAEQLKALSNATHDFATDDNGVSYSTMCYKLGDDITVDETFLPIGTQGEYIVHTSNFNNRYNAVHCQDHGSMRSIAKNVRDERGEFLIKEFEYDNMGFRGIFDGDGKTIRGLRGALFDSFSQAADGITTVKNLTLEVDIHNNPYYGQGIHLGMKEINFVGGLANTVYGDICIDGVTVKGSVIGETINIDDYDIGYTGVFRHYPAVVGGLIGLLSPEKEYNGTMRDVNCTIKNTVVDAVVQGDYAGLVIGDSRNPNVTAKRLALNKEFILIDNDNKDADPIEVYLGITVGENASATTTRNTDDVYKDNRILVFSDVDLPKLSYNNMLVGRGTPKFFNGEGTQDSPLQLGTAYDYLRIIKLSSLAVSEGSDKFVGVDDRGNVYQATYPNLNYIVTDDLDFTDKSLEIAYRMTLDDGLPNYSIDYAEIFNGARRADETLIPVDYIGFNIDTDGSLTVENKTIKGFSAKEADCAGFVAYNNGRVVMNNVRFDNFSLGGGNDTKHYESNRLDYKYEWGRAIGCAVAYNDTEGSVELNNINVSGFKFCDKLANPIEPSASGTEAYYKHAGALVGLSKGRLAINTEDGAQSTINGQFVFTHPKTETSYKYEWGSAVGHAECGNGIATINNVLSYVDIPDRTACNAIMGTAEVGETTGVRINNCYDMSDNGSGNLVELTYGRNPYYPNLYQKGYIVNSDAEAGLTHLLGSTDYTFRVKRDDFNKLQWDDDNAWFETKTFSSTGSGSGSEFEPYLICNEEDFMTFLKAVHDNYFNVNGVNCTKNIRVKMMHDLNFSGDERLTDIDGNIIGEKVSSFVPYTDGASFNGYIDGNGMTISGMTTHLFANLKGAHVKNIGIVDSSIDGFALVADAEGCTFENCYVSGKSHGIANVEKNTFVDCYTYNTASKEYEAIGTVNAESFYAADAECNISGHPILKSASYKLTGSDAKTYYSDATLVIPNDNKMYYYESSSRLHRLEGINYNSWSEQIVDGGGEATEVHDAVSPIDYYYVLKNYYTNFEYGADAYMKWGKAKPHGVNPLMDNVCLLHNVWRDGEYLTKYADQQKGYTSIDEFDHARYIYSLYLTDKKDLGFDPNKVLTRIRNIHYQRTGTNGGMNTVYLPFPFNATDVKKADGTAISGVKAFMLADRIKISNKTGHDEYYYDRNAEVWDYYSDFHEGVDYDRLFFVQLTNAQMDEVTAGLPMLLNVKEKDWYIDIKDLGDKYRVSDGNYGEDHLGTETGWDDTWADNKYALFSTCAMKDGDEFNMRYHADIIGEDQMGYSFRTVDNMGQDFACSGHAAHLGSFVTVQKGTLLSKESSGEYTFFKLNSSGNAFAHVTSNSSVTPFRTYVSIHKSSDPDAKAKTSFGMGSANFGIVEKDDIATDLDEMPGITLLTVEQQKIYSLDGIQVGTLDNVSKLAPGVYIMNGRKFVKK